MTKTGRLSLSLHRPPCQHPSAPGPRRPLRVQVVDSQHANNMTLSWKGPLKPSDEGNRGQWGEEEWWWSETPDGYVNVLGSGVICCYASLSCSFSCSVWLRLSCSYCQWWHKAKKPIILKVWSAEYVWRAENVNGQPKGFSHTVRLLAQTHLVYVRFDYSIY